MPILPQRGPVNRCTLPEKLVVEVKEVATGGCRSAGAGVWVRSRASVDRAVAAELLPVPAGADFVLAHLDHELEATPELGEAVDVSCRAAELLRIEHQRVVGRCHDDEPAGEGLVRVAGRRHHLMLERIRVGDAQEVGVLDGFGTELVEHDRVLSLVPLEYVARRARDEVGLPLFLRVPLGERSLAGPGGSENPDGAYPRAGIAHALAPLPRLHPEPLGVHVLNLPAGAGILRAGEL